MNAITVYQPQASLLAYRAKQYETRSWATKYRGPIAIHAGTKNFDLRHFNSKFAKTVLDAFSENGLSIDDLPFGCIIATAELVDCVEVYRRGRPKEYVNQIWLNYSRGDGMCDDRQVVGNELLLGYFAPGYFAWEFENMTLLPEPIPAIGRQKLWNWEA